MSGHSKWSTVKRKKGAADARRGQLFARLIRAIELAAREGGGPQANPTLADAIERAKNNSVPRDTIERAIKRGSGELEGVAYDAVQYEGYAPGGVAVLVDCLTDNRNRTAAEVRSVFTKHGGSLADPGSVAYLFHRRGQILLGSDGASEDDVLAAGLDAGLEDLEVQDDSIIAWCDPSDTRFLRETFEKSGFKVKEATSTMVPSSSILITEPETARKVLRLLDALDEHGDVQDFYANVDVPDALLDQLSE